MGTTRLVLLGGLAMWSTGAMADPVNGGTGSKKVADPNRMVCRTIESTGSRLKKERQCQTAAQWAAAGAAERRDIEKIQANRWKGE